MSEEQIQALRMEVIYLRRKIDKKHVEVSDLRNKVDDLETENSALKKKLNRYSSKHKTYQINEAGDRIYDELFSITYADVISLQDISLNAKCDRKFISDAAIALYGEGVLRASSVTGKKPKGGACKPPLDRKGIQIIVDLMEERLDQCRKSSKSKSIDEERSSLAKIEKTLRVKIANLNKKPNINSVLATWNENDTDSDIEEEI